MTSEVIRAVVPHTHARRLEHRFEFRRVDLYVTTLPWWRRAALWLVWQTGLGRLLQRWFISPYTLIYIEMVPKSSDDASH